MILFPQILATDKSFIRLFIQLLSSSTTVPTGSSTLLLQIFGAKKKKIRMNVQNIENKTRKKKKTFHHLP